MKLPRLPWWGWVIAILALGGLLALAIWKLGVWGTLLLPAYAAGAALNGAAKAAGAQPIPENNTGRPRRPGPSAISPTPPEGEKRARPRRNNWR